MIKIYSVFGGLPKYYALIDQFQLWNKSFGEIMQELVFKRFAPLGFELKEMIVNEFTRNNSVYLSILQAIASGKSTVTEIAKAVSIPATSAVKYLTELEKKKGLIKRLNPIGTADPSRSKYGRYSLNNYFENFWFRFIQPDIISYEMGYYEKMMAAVAQQLPVYIQQRINLIIKELLFDNSTHPLIAKAVGIPVDEIGEAWNREVSFDLAVKGNDPKQILLGSIFSTPFQLSTQGVIDYKRNVDSMMKMYPGYEPEYLLVTWENPSVEFKEYLENSNIKHLLLNDILSLTGYMPKTEKTKRYTLTESMKPAPTRHVLNELHKISKKTT
ncbi:MAG: hypothetical protein HYV28_03080 [Ignavibacteriales bacterium]|nr:hypothetical protein [Ignavibacteriales bacterium]